MLAGRADVGIVYAMLRYIAVVEQGYMGVSEGVARFFASYGEASAVGGDHSPVIVLSHCTLVSCCACPAADYACCPS